MSNLSKLVIYVKPPLPPATMAQKQIPDFHQEGSRIRTRCKRQFCRARRDDSNELRKSKIGWEMAERQYLKGLNRDSHSKLKFEIRLAQWWDISDPKFLSYSERASNSAPYMWNSSKLVTYVNPPPLPTDWCPTLTHVGRWARIYKDLQTAGRSLLLQFDVKRVAVLTSAPRFRTSYK